MESIQDRDGFYRVFERMEAIQARAWTGQITRSERKEFVRLRDARDAYLSLHGDPFHIEISDAATSPGSTWNREQYDRVRLWLDLFGEPGETDDAEIIQRRAHLLAELPSCPFHAPAEKV